MGISYFLNMSQAGSSEPTTPTNNKQRAAGGRSPLTRGERRREVDPYMVPYRPSTRTYITVVNQRRFFSGTLYTSNLHTVQWKPSTYANLYMQYSHKPATIFFPVHYISIICIPYNGSQVQRKPSAYLFSKLVRKTGTFHPAAART